MVRSRESARGKQGCAKKRGLHSRAIVDSYTRELLLMDCELSHLKKYGRDMTVN